MGARDMVGDNAINPMLPAVPTPQRKGPPAKRKGPSGPALIEKIPQAPRNVPKPTVPKSLGPLGGGTGEADPQLTPRNSKQGVKQRMSLNVPGVKTR